MAQAMKFLSEEPKSEIVEGLDKNYEKRKSEIDKKLAKIKSSFDSEYAKWVTRKQSESSSKHGNQSTDGDSSQSRNSISQQGRPKANRMETKPELPGHTIHGFINEILFLKNLLKEPEGFKTLAILGKYGVGKTALCQVLFNEEEVKRAYLPRIWVSMYSEETKEGEDPKIDVVKRILRALGVEDEMLEHIKTEAEEESRTKTEAGEREKETSKEKELSRLLHALHLNLVGKKYLIVVDDFRDDDEWLDDEKNQHLSRGFPKSFGGRVIVTTRDESVAKKIVEEEENIQRLFPISDRESVWNIYIEAVTKNVGDAEAKNVGDAEAKNVGIAAKVNPRYPGRFKKELMDKSGGIPLVVQMLAKIEPKRVDETAGEDVERKKTSNL